MSETETLSRVQVAAVPQDHILRVWPKVSHYIAAACKYTRGRFEAEDVLDQILDGDHILWIAFEDQNIKGAVVTNIMYYPRSKWVGCPFVTGDDFASWKYPMLRTLQRWARDNGCEGLESTARLGWARVFKEDGYEPLWQTFQLPAAEGE